MYAKVEVKNDVVGTLETAWMNFPALPQRGDPITVGEHSGKVLAVEWISGPDIFGKTEKGIVNINLHVSIALTGAAARNP